MSNARLTLNAFRDGILKNDRIILSKAITLVESRLPGDQQLASELIDSILPHTGKSIRIGISGVPGVGKSTFIDSFGKLITDSNKKIAVLTIDPSSQLTKGSILGDKTRMESLSKNKLAFIRPSSAGESIGGVAQRTRESILVCEAAGYEAIIVETVGVGQSEIAVRNMVDFFLLLMLAGAGDELQGIKKGIMEMADAVVITKADGDNIKNATDALATYQHALHMQPEKPSHWTPKVLTCSAYSGDGIAKIWECINQYIQKTRENGFFDHNRQQQNLSWFNDQFLYLLKTDLMRFENVIREKASLENSLLEQKVSPRVAAQKLMEAYRNAVKHLK